MYLFQNSLIPLEYAYIRTTLTWFSPSTMWVLRINPRWCGCALWLAPVSAEPSCSLCLTPFSWRVKFTWCFSFRLWLLITHCCWLKPLCVYRGCWVNSLCANWCWLDPWRPNRGWLDSLCTDGCWLDPLDMSGMWSIHRHQLHGVQVYCRRYTNTSLSCDGRVWGLSWN